MGVFRNFEIALLASRGSLLDTIGLGNQRSKEDKNYFLSEQMTLRTSTHMV